MFTPIPYIIIYDALVNDLMISQQFYQYKNSISVGVIGNGLLKAYARNLQILLMERPSIYGIIGYYVFLVPVMWLRYLQLLLPTC
jgi:hypothetical protein